LEVGDVVNITILATQSENKVIPAINLTCPKVNMTLEFERKNVRFYCSSSFVCLFFQISKEVFIIKNASTNMTGNYNCKVKSIRTIGREQQDDLSSSVEIKGSFFHSNYFHIWIIFNNLNV
jgi:hypothetical protein